MADRGRDTSYALTEARTVLSRAQSAIRRLEWSEQYHPDEIDPDHWEMKEALLVVTDLLDPWRRTGR